MDHLAWARKPPPQANASRRNPETCGETVSKTERGISGNQGFECPYLAQILDIGPQV
jgi:hypothetical protein